MVEGVAMATLEQLVPPFELCRKIPADAFNGTALVWKTYHRGIIADSPYVAERDIWDHEFREDAEQPIIPAPTAQEILEAMHFSCPTVECGYFEWDGVIRYSCTVVLNAKKTEFLRCGGNLPETLLKLWMDIRRERHPNASRQGAWRGRNL